MQWEMWRNELPLLEMMEVSRCFKLKETENLKKAIPEQWKFIEGKKNPADDASRGLSPKDLLQCSRWLRGPSFLWDHHDSWRNSDNGEPESLQPDDKEVRKASSLTTHTINKDQFATLLQRLEFLFKLV